MNRQRSRILTAIAAIGALVAAGRAGEYPPCS